MPLAEPAVRAGVLTILPDYLARRGIRSDPLLQQAGLDPLAVSDPRALIPLTAVVTVFERAAESLDEPSFGLDYARHFPIGGSGLLGHMLMSAPDIRQALNVTAHYLAVHMTVVRATFELQGNDGCFSWKWPVTLNVASTQYTAFALGTLTLRLSLAAGSDWHPLSVGFEHREPVDLTAYRKFFRTHLLFDQSANSLLVDASTLAKPMPKVLEGLYDSVRDLGDRVLLEQAAVTDIASRTQTEIARRFDAETPFDLEAIATALELTPRALQWRLAQEATTYEKIVGLTRILRTEHMLRDTNHPITTIAALLGFSEHSAFTRWAKRQFGHTPKNLRRRLRGNS